jgi:hypothetical protein
MKKSDYNEARWIFEDDIKENQRYKKKTTFSYQNLWK